MKVKIVDGMWVNLGKGYNPNKVEIEIQIRKKSEIVKCFDKDNVFQYSFTFEIMQEKLNTGEWKEILAPLEKKVMKKVKSKTVPFVDGMWINNKIGDSKHPIQLKLSLDGVDYLNNNKIMSTFTLKRVKGYLNTGTFIPILAPKKKISHKKEIIPKVGMWIKKENSDVGELWVCGDNSDCIHYVDNFGDSGYTCYTKLSVKELLNTGKWKVVKKPIKVKKLYKEGMWVKDYSVSPFRFMKLTGRNKITRQTEKVSITHSLEKAELYLRDGIWVETNIDHFFKDGMWIKAPKGKDFFIVQGKLDLENPNEVKFTGEHNLTYLLAEVNENLALGIWKKTKGPKKVEYVEGMWITNEQGLIRKLVVDDKYIKAWDKYNLKYETYFKDSAMDRLQGKWKVLSTVPEFRYKEGMWIKQKNSKLPLQIKAEMNDINNGEENFQINVFNIKGKYLPEIKVDMNIDNIRIKDVEKLLAKKIWISCEKPEAPTFKNGMWVKWKEDKVVKIGQLNINDNKNIRGVVDLLVDGKKEYSYYLSIVNENLQSYKWGITKAPIKLPLMNREIYNWCNFPYHLKVKNSTTYNIMDNDKVLRAINKDIFLHEIECGNWFLKKIESKTPCLNHGN